MWGSLATMAIAWVVSWVNVDRRLMLGAFAILAGAALLSWDGHGISVDAGALLVMGACVAWGVDNNFNERPIRAADITTAKTMAANTTWYDHARACRLVLDGRELHWRARGP